MARNVLRFLAGGCFFPISVFPSCYSSRAFFSSLRYLSDLATHCSLASLCIVIRRVIRSLVSGVGLTIIHPLRCYARNNIGLFAAFSIIMERLYSPDALCSDSLLYPPPPKLASGRSQIGWKLYRQPSPPRRTLRRNRHLQPLSRMYNPFAVS